MKGRLARFSLLCVFVIQPISCYAVSILGNCTFTTPAGINFGTYNPLSASSISSNASAINVTCTGILSLFSYSIALDHGLHGSFNPRAMASAGTTTLLNYNIYTDSADSTIWGDGSSGTAIQSNSILTILFPVNINYTLYARIPGSQSTVQVPSGQASATYSDTITVTYTYN